MLDGIKNVLIAGFFNIAWNNLGVLAWLSGDTEIAKEWFTKALTVEPEKAQENLNKMK